MPYRILAMAVAVWVALLASSPALLKAQSPDDRPFLAPINVDVPDVRTDPSVTIDYPIVYVRAPRFGDEKNSHWAEVGDPTRMDPGADLVLLKPDGSEEVLVEGGDGSVTDPAVSFDGQWIYYARFHNLNKDFAPWGGLPVHGSDIYKIHVQTREVVQLTDQRFTPNLGAADWNEKFGGSDRGRDHIAYGVLNLGPCPLPGGKLAFVSNRNGFRPPKYARPTLQLFVMDEDGGNLEQIGYLNISQALHPVVLVDGRVMFSSFENQGLRSSDSWGLWAIRPDGTHWEPLFSAFEVSGIGANNSFHFQTQRSDRSIVLESYYINNNNGFGGYLKFPPGPAKGYAAFGPADPRDERNAPQRMGRHYNGVGAYLRYPFTPYGVESLTPFTHGGEGESGLSDLNNPKSPRVGKFTHPSGAPGNHLLTCYSPGPINSQNSLKLPVVDGGIYLIKSGEPVAEPAQMLLIKNDPKYNEQWPRAVVPYRRIYGVDEPERLPRLANDGKLSPHLPEGTPLGLVGTSSLYKRESFPFGKVPEGSVTASYHGGDDPYEGLDPFNSAENGASYNWTHQGADAGKYTNDDIHAIRILVMEPTTDRVMTAPQGSFYNHATERLRILGEIPVRKFGMAASGRVDGGDGGAKSGETRDEASNQSRDQPIDPDGNPDTSFLAKIPADVAWTFQTLDKNGMVLNMSQTWHQLRPGEIRNDCGGCHAHSQQPTPFERTAAARSDYQIWDLTERTPLLTAKERDESGKQWDRGDTTGVQFEGGVKNIEFYRDIKPILDRSCVACHTGKSDKPASKLVLDDDDPVVAIVNQLTLPSGTYYRLAADREARFGYKPVSGYGWRYSNASRYIRMFQSRRSLLVWKIFGERLDGWTNDDFPTETVPGDPSTLVWKGEPIANTPQNRNLADLDFTGSIMPPPTAVAGTYEGPGGTKIKVEPLTDEDRLTIVRWIDLGCPIDMDYDPSQPDRMGYGWMCDDNRPTLCVTYPQPGVNEPLSRLLVGMYDYGSGLDLASFTVTADFKIDGVAAGENLASRFRETTRGVWELTLGEPIRSLESGTLHVSIQDRQGNVTRIDRLISIPALH